MYMYMCVLLFFTFSGALNHHHGILALLLSCVIVVCVVGIVTKDDVGSWHHCYCTLLILEAQISYHACTGLLLSKEMELVVLYGVCNCIHISSVCCGI